jgi:fucose permease
LGPHLRAPRYYNGDGAEKGSVYAVADSKSVARERLNRERAMLGATFAFGFLYFICELSIGTWLPAYATLKRLADPTEAAFLGSFYWGCFTCGWVSGICTSRWIKSTRLVLLDLAVLLLAISCIVVTDCLGVGTSQLLWPCMAAYIFALGTIIASCMAMLTEAGVQMTGRRLSGFSVCGLGGDVTGQSIMSFVFTELGPSAMILATLRGVIVTSLCLFGAIVAVLLPRVKRMNKKTNPGRAMSVEWRPNP